MNKQIAFITDEYSEAEFSSGGVKLNFALILELIKNGYKVDIYSKKYSKKTGMANAYYNFNELVLIKDLKNKYDIVLSEKGIYPSDVTYIHDHSMKYRFPIMYKSKLSRFLYRVFMHKKHSIRVKRDKLIKQNLDKTDKIIVSSNVLKQDIINNFNQDSNKLFILPPAVKQNPNAEFRAKSEFTIFGLSAVGLKRKGFYEVLKATKELRKTQKYFLVKIIYPKYKNNLLLQIYIKLNKLDKYIKFVSLQKNMDNFYETIDFMLMPSKVEPFGMVAIEAMANYKPCLTTECCGACDIINDKNLICKEEDLAQNMKKLINLSIEDYEKIAKSAYEKVKDISWEKFCKSYIDILQK